jgi:L-alanine-DL-glutamate epimerase-like enolase superfamily enzyme
VGMLAEAGTGVNTRALLLCWAGGAGLDRLGQPNRDPLGNMSGGCYRDKIPCVSSIRIKPTFDATVDGVREKRAEAYFLFNCKIGELDTQVEVRNIAAVRQMLGPEVALQMNDNAGMQRLLEVRFSAECRSNPWPMGVPRARPADATSR